MPRSADSARESLLPRPAEIAIGVLLIAFLVGTLVMPTVEIDPYADALADESSAQLRARLANPDISRAHALRALRYLADSEGEVAAVREALKLLPRTATPRVFREYIAAHPVASAAGDVLKAWHAGQIPDGVWQRDMADAWAPVSVWVAIPLTASLDYDDPRNRWVFDVLARGDEHHYSIPGGVANDPLARKTGPQVFVATMVQWFNSLPAHAFEGQTQQRIFINLPRIPADVLADPSLRTALAECLSSVASDRRVPLSASDTVAEEYATQILVLLRRFVFPAELAPPPDESPEARAARLQAERVNRQQAVENWRSLLTYIITSTRGEPDAWTRACQAMLNQN